MWFQFSNADHLSLIGPSSPYIWSCELRVSDDILMGHPPPTLEMVLHTTLSRSSHGLSFPSLVYMIRLIGLFMHWAFEKPHKEENRPKSKPHGSSMLMAESDWLCCCFLWRCLNMFFQKRLWKQRLGTYQKYCSIFLLCFD